MKLNISYNINKADEMESQSNVFFKNSQQQASSLHNSNNTSTRKRLQEHLQQKKAASGTTPTPNSNPPSMQSNIAIVSPVMANPQQQHTQAVPVTPQPSIGHYPLPIDNYQHPQQQPMMTNKMNNFEQYKQQQQQHPQYSSQFQQQFNSNTMDQTSAYMSNDLSPTTTTTTVTVTTQHYPPPQPIQPPQAMAQFSMHKQQQPMSMSNSNNPLSHNLPPVNNQMNHVNNSTLAYKNPDQVCNFCKRKYCKISLIKHLI